MKNTLITIENGLLTTYDLDEKPVWEVGRPSKDNEPDIKLHSATVSRHHGIFYNKEGRWFYEDKNSKNGTIYNKTHISNHPVELKNGDHLIFGGGDEAIINSRTIWTLFLEKDYGDDWRVEDTRNIDTFVVANGDQKVLLTKPEKGTVIETEGGVAIYMGEITYLNGNVMVEMSINVI